LQAATAAALPSDSIRARISAGLEAEPVVGLGVGPEAELDCGSERGGPDKIIAPLTVCPELVAVPVPDTPTEVEPPDVVPTDVGSPYPAPPADGLPVEGPGLPDPVKVLSGATITPLAPSFELVTSGEDTGAGVDVTSLKVGFSLRSAVTPVLRAGVCMRTIATV
jgi:hypothetical protein